MTINITKSKSTNQLLTSEMGKKMLIMIETFPFFVVGKLESVKVDHIEFTPQFGVPVQLRGKTFNIDLDQIAAFFIESHENKIPEPFTAQ